MTFQAVALIVTLVAATPNNDLPPNAVESVWMKAETVITESRKMKAKGMMPASIDCRIDSISGTAAVYSMKIVWVPNDAGIIWRFGVGTAEENFKLEEGNRASGIRNVWSKQLIDKASGWHASCVLWEGPGYRRNAGCPCAARRFSSILPSTFPACLPGTRSTASSSCRRQAGGRNRPCAGARGIPEELFSRIRFYCQRRHFAFDDDYQVLPICGMGDEPGTLRVLDYPKQSVMMGIAAAL
ncbi:hypothetical protein NKI25_25900 [Mesorhizobium sp. M0808]|uniref:hypothetical protein n=1 Tax=Mesorhizobium sp. M0808 TaxID=2957002 RepID=UPI0033373776